VGLENIQVLHVGGVEREWGRGGEGRRSGGGEKGVWTRERNQCELLLQRQ